MGLCDAGRRGRADRILVAGQRGPLTGPRFGPPVVVGIGVDLAAGGDHAPVEPARRLRELLLRGELDVVAPGSGPSLLALEAGGRAGDHLVVIPGAGRAMSRRKVVRRARRLTLAT